MDVAELVPHTGVARLLTSIVSSSLDRVEAIGRIPARHPLVVDGMAPALLAIELGAQAAAAMQAIGRCAESGGQPAAQVGSLVRVREARFGCSSLPVERPIQISARLEGSAPPLAIYRVSATLDDVAVLEAVISTHAGQVGGRS